MASNRVKNGRDVEKAVLRAGGEVRRCKGSHGVATCPNGAKVTYHYHGEYGPGIRSKIVKALVRGGVLVAVLVYVALCLI